VPVDHEPSPARLRIGELSRRLGVSDHVLRAWERRYGLLRPVRSPGGFRLYSDADLRRIQRMQAHLAQGLSAAEAARAAIEDERAGRPGSDVAGTPPASRLDEAARALAGALDGFDEPAAQAVLDRLMSSWTVETVIRDVLIPYLRDLGERWLRGAINVGQEHFASNVIRERVTGFSRGWGGGHGPLALLACPPGELHDIALIAFGVVLHRNGWRIHYLGADTPLADLARTAAATDPDLVVIAATEPQRFDGLAGDLAELARDMPLALAGAGATQSLAGAIGARLLTDDPVTAAERAPVPSRRPPPPARSPRAAG
jgi:MerR family transcriptional regulator, light-induced transcriptional regulator